nr:hypothetical protein [Fimbriiglobus ruber]
MLKYIVSWAIFNGEQPFKDRNVPISMKSQLLGVTEGSEWFFGDARMMGPNGRHTLDAMGRLGTLLRTNRFSDKPVECSCTSFSCDVPQADDRARYFIGIAQKWSLLVRVASRKDRSSDRLDMHLQINLMLSPKWDLAVYRRGVLSLSPNEIDAIFDKDQSSQFDAVIANRSSLMSPPFVKSKRLKSHQPGLWSDEQD